MAYAAVETPLEGRVPVNESEQPPWLSRALAPARAPFSFLLATALLVNFPLALLFGLKAQLRDLAPPDPGPVRAFASKVYETGTLPRSLAFSLRPEAILQSRAVESPRPDSTAFVPPERLSPEGAEWRIARGVPPGGDALDDRPPRRTYDPLAPPSPAS